MRTVQLLILQQTYQYKPTRFISLVWLQYHAADGDLVDVYIATGRKVELPLRLFLREIYYYVIMSAAVSYLLARYRVQRR